LKKHCFTSVYYDEDRDIIKKCLNDIADHLREMRTSTKVLLLTGAVVYWYVLATCIDVPSLTFLSQAQQSRRSSAHRLGGKNTGVSHAHVNIKHFIDDYDNN
jgi:hypothetical protein